LRSQGSWLAIRTNGRFAAITNVREGVPEAAPRSRGEWILKHLLDQRPALDSARACSDADGYAGFNALFGSFSGGRWQLAYGSNRYPPRIIEPGLHALCNGEPDARWPKIERARAALAALLASGAEPEEHWLDALADPNPAPDHLLPDTGVGLAKERWLSPLLIVGEGYTGEGYGTRAATWLCLHRSGRARLIERTLVPERQGAIASVERAEFRLVP
jgi:uncharacterized protein with NRDE domain